jgi:hypothetical protein
MVSLPYWLFSLWLLAAPCGVLVGGAAGAWLWHRAKSGLSPLPPLRLPGRAKAVRLDGDPAPRERSPRMPV